MNSGCFGSELHSTTVLEEPSNNMKDDQLCNCAKASPGKKKFLAADWGVSFGAAF